MADFAGDALIVLNAVANTFRKHYYPGIQDRIVYFGSAFRKMLPSFTTLNGPSMEIEVKTAVSRATRVSKRLLDPMPPTRAGRKLRYTVQYDPDDDTRNNFSGFETALKVDVFSLWKRSDPNWKGATDPIAELLDEMMSDLRESFHKWLHLPSDGKLCALDTTTPKKNDDSDLYASMTTYTAGSATAAFKFANAGAARIGESQWIEFRNPTTGALVMGPVRVTYVHPVDDYFTAAIITTGPETTVDSVGSPVTNFNAVTASHAVYVAGSYGQAIDGGLEYLFGNGTYFGQNRLAETGKMLIPLRYSVGTDVDQTEDHWTIAGEAVGWMAGDGNAMNKRVVQMARDQFRGARKIAKDGGLNIVPSSSQDVRGDLKRIIGEDGFIVHDPNLGQMALDVNDLAEYGQIDFLDMETFVPITPWPGQEFRFFDGSIAGIWERNTEDDGSGRPSKFYSANGILALCLANKWPKGNLRLMGFNKNA